MNDEKQTILFFVDNCRKGQSEIIHPFSFKIVLCIGGILLENTAP